MTDDLEKVPVTIAEVKRFLASMDNPRPVDDGDRALLKSLYSSRQPVSTMDDVLDQAARMLIVLLNVQKAIDHEAQPGLRDQTLVAAVSSTLIEQLRAVTAVDHASPNVNELTP